MKLVPVMALLCLTALVSRAQEEGERWAVLVAGSHKWVHYRHQASICHAYQLLHNQGIPDDHIVVIMYDDIAYNSKNPNPGVIINEPDGPNVYEGVPIDYKGIHVTAHNFLKVLEGNDTGMADIGSGKVVRSGPNDRIFVNLVDGGGFDHFAFPYGVLTAQALHNHINQMYADQKYKEMMIFIESNSAGSMILNKYPDEMGVYAMTATGEIGNAYAMHFSEELDTWLADTFTLAWMTNSEMNDPATQTIGEQFNITKEWVRTSTVHSYGNMDIQQELVSAFFGNGGLNRSSSTSKQDFLNLQKEAVKGTDIPVAYIDRHLKTAKDDDEISYWMEQLTSLQENRKFVEETMRKIALKVTADKGLIEKDMQVISKEPTDWDCYGPAVESFHNNCFNLGQNHYGLRMLGTLKNLCAEGFTADDVAMATLTVCTFPAITGIN